MNAEVIKKEGMTAKGKIELLKHMEGIALTQKQAIISKCYDCMGWYSDGKVDCGMDQCSLYPFMPYNPNRRRGKPKTEEQRAKLKAQLHPQNRF